MNTYKHYKKKGEETLLHRHIMEEHLGRKLSYNEVVHHINGNKRDNRIENLMVMTRAEHSRLHQLKTPLIGICVICGKEFVRKPKNLKAQRICSKECMYIMRSRVSRQHKGKPINQFTLNGEFVKAWRTGGEIQRELGFAKTNVIRVCQKGGTAYGFVWKYCE